MFSVLGFQCAVDSRNPKINVSAMGVPSGRSGQGQSPVLHQHVVHDLAHRLPGPCQSKREWEQKQNCVSHDASCVFQYTLITSPMCLLSPYIGPLGHGTHHLAPKTQHRGSAPGGPHSDRPRSLAHPLILPSHSHQSVFGPVLPRP